MNIQLIAMDIDDTLLDNTMKISDRNKDAIRKAQAKGIRIALASGRPTPSMITVAEELGIAENGFIISYNGASILDLSNGKIIHTSSVAKDLTHELIELSKIHDTYIHTYIDGHIVTEEINHYTTIESDITGLPVKQVDSLRDAVTSDVVKVLMLENPEKLRSVENILKDVIQDRLSMYISKPFFLEFMQSGTDKGNSLAILARYLSIPQEQTMAIGDSYNDLSMIKWAAVGVAMDNAPEDIKKHATYITSHHNDSGVASAIEKFCLL